MESRNANVPQKTTLLGQTRKPYATPQVTLYGTVEDLTTKTGTGTDGGGTGAAPT